MKRSLTAPALIAGLLCVLLLTLAGVVSAQQTPPAPASPQPQVAEKPSGATPQDGLPPELRISDKPDATEQLKQLQTALALAAAQPGAQKAGGGGILGGLSSLFGGGEKQAQPVSVAILSAHAEVYKGLVVSVDGVWAPLAEKGTGVFRSETGECKIIPAGGTVPTGFPEGSIEGMPVRAEGLVEIGEGGKALIRATKIQPSMPLLSLRIARLYEMLGRWDEAKKSYSDVAKLGMKSGYWLAGHAQFSQGRITADKLHDAKAASNELWMAWQNFSMAEPNGTPRYYVWRPKIDGTGWEKLSIRDALHEPLDSLARQKTSYKIVDFFVSVCGGSPGLGVLLIALVVRIGIYPLTKKQMHSGKAMQKLQPQIKALQQEFKDDKQKFQDEFWKLCKANQVSPFGGCLPMIVQMPILIFIYQGIRSYIVRFDGHTFLWVHNLSQPDMVLLVMYTLSMILFQKMTTKMQPTMDPQQAQQQQMMTYMMPLMFFMFFKTMSSAFILYWLGTNIIYFVQQWLYMRDAKPALATAVEDGGRQGKIAPIPDAQPKSQGFSAIMDALKGKKPEAPTSVQPKSFDAAEKAAQGKKTHRDEAAKDPRKRRRSPRGGS